MLRFSQSNQTISTLITFVIIDDQGGILWSTVPWCMVYKMCNF